MKAKVQDGTLVKYPYNLFDLRQDNPRTSMPEGGWPTDLSYFGVVDVVDTAPPTPSATQSVVEATPILVGAVWTQQWTLRNWSAEEIAAATAATADTARLAAIDAAIIADADMTLLRKATVAQIDAKVGAITNLAEAKQYLARLTKVVAYALRRGL